MISFSVEERDARLVYYISEDDTIDLWTLMVDWVSLAIQYDKTEEQAHALLQHLWENTEVRVVQ